MIKEENLIIINKKMTNLTEDKNKIKEMIEIMEMKHMKEKMFKKELIDNKETKLQKMLQKNKRILKRKVLEVSPHQESRKIKLQMKINIVM